MLGTVLVVDDHPLMLSGLRILIGSLGLGLHIETCHSAETAHAKATKISDLRLIILDFTLPILSGVPAVELFKKDFPNVPLIVLSGSEDRRIWTNVVRAGAMAYVSKTAPPEVLLDLILSAIQGATERKLLKQTVQEHCCLGDQLSLTERQKQVLKFLMKGRSNKEIAIYLNIAEVTAKTHVAALMRKFGAANRTQVVVEAQRQGLLPVEDYLDSTINAEHNK